MLLSVEMMARSGKDMRDVFGAIYCAKIPWTRLVSPVCEIDTSIRKVLLPIASRVACTRSLQTASSHNMYTSTHGIVDDSHVLAL